MRHGAKQQSRSVLSAKAFLALGLTLFSSSDATIAEDVKPIEKTLNWLQDYGEALKSAVASQRPVWLQFTGPWCPNCHKMDKETFRHPRVIEQLTKHFVPAKISCENNADLALSFGFTQLPSSVLISPEGKILARHEGFADPETFSKLTETAGLKTNLDLPTTEPVTGDSSQTRLLASTSKEKSTAVDLISSPRGDDQETLEIAMLEPLSDLKAKLNETDQAPPTEAAEMIDPSEKQKDKITPDSNNSQSSASALPEPLGHFCPVTLLNRAVLLESGNEHTASYAGNRYFFSSAEARAQFAAEPEKYVPVRGGDCLVSLTQGNQEIKGQKDFPVVYDHRIYLCASEQNRQLFLQNPSAYAGQDLRDSGYCPHCKAPLNLANGSKSRFQIRFGGSRYQFPDKSHMEAFIKAPLNYLRR